MQSRSRDIVINNGSREGASWYSHDGTDDIYCFVQPRTCNYGNQCAAQLQHNPVGYGTSKKPVCDNQEIETYVHLHLSSYLDFMTDKRMTFDEFIAE